MHSCGGSGTDNELYVVFWIFSLSVASPDVNHRTNTHLRHIIILFLSKTRSNTHFYANSLTLSPLPDSWWVSWSSRSPHFCPPRSDHLPSSVLQQRKETPVKTGTDPCVWVCARACVCVSCPDECVHTSAWWSVTSTLSKDAPTKTTTKYHGFTLISGRVTTGGVILLFEVTFESDLNSVNVEVHRQSTQNPISTHI